MPLHIYSCDEWYHTQCVNMPDLEVDLVDQFICPICVASAFPDMDAFVDSLILIVWQTTRMSL